MLCGVTVPGYCSTKNNPNTRGMHAKFLRERERETLSLISNQIYTLLWGILEALIKYKLNLIVRWLARRQVWGNYK
jgi:hypothetical protein